MAVMFIRSVAVVLLPALFNGFIVLFAFILREALMLMEVTSRLMPMMVMVVTVAVAFSGKSQGQNNEGSNLHFYSS
eukprot:CAMPEP_0170491794 /NCGR_PEP_ID=MMETSP0208-20121228/11258_1 /TAXON_ID=197538 /ORGANISM="Strombidium inclinatum, Strain S3" /LENGTH=75 /DNA_ID=CAMNT_0010767425 /DNA_START=276 /DNA_END=499 /DNA_ORIENTATION=-